MSGSPLFALVFASSSISFSIFMNFGNFFELTYFDYDGY
jgi:hypothetical protein